MVAKLPLRVKRVIQVKLHFQSSQPLREEFDRCMRQSTAEAPTEDARLLLWWPSFKRQVVQHAVGLNRQQRAEAGSVALKAARAALSAAYAAVEAGDNAGFAAIVQARERVTVAEAAEAAQVSASQRRQWLHDGERPGPVLTAQLRPPIAAGAVAAIRASSGAVVQDPQQCADILVGHFARVSAVPQTTPAAQSEVLASLAAGPKPTPAQTEALNSLSFSEQDVRRALRRARLGTAPGPDGIPMSVYHKYWSVLAPLFARLFSVATILHHLPPGFLDGTTAVLPRGGDRLDPAQYRPITLLNTDYRILTRAMASRLQSPM